MVGIERLSCWIFRCVVIALLCGSSGIAVGLEPFSTQSDPADALKPSVAERSVQEIAAIARKSVVVVSFSGRDGQRQGFGAGFIVSPDGLIATNLHVIGEARPIRIELHDGRKFDVTSVLATERSQDLALLKIDATGLQSLSLGNSDELQEGQPVIAIGNPLGLERSVVSGILSGRREIEGRTMLQLAIPIERGNSGGPLLDMQGRVHGLLTLKSLKTENLGFAIAVNALKPLIEKPNPIPMNRWLTIGALNSDVWTVLPGGRWRQRAGKILAEGIGGGFGGRSLCLAKDAVPEIPYEVAVQVNFSPSDGAAGLVFHSDGSDRHYGFYPSNGNMRLSRFDGPDVYSWNVLGEVRPKTLRKDGWNSLKVRVEEKRFLCYLNGDLVFESTDSVFQSGRVGLCKFRQTEAQFKGFRIGKTLDESSPSDELKERTAKTVDGLAFDEASISQAVKELSQQDPAVTDRLEQHARELELRAARIRRIASDVHSTRTLGELHRLIEQSPADLLRASLTIARIDNPELDIEAYVQEVDRHANQAKSTFADASTEKERLDALNHYLFQEQGFHGSRTDYGNRSNSYVNEVLDDREGLPITLSILFIEIAKRIGLNVVGVGMPSHFLVRHEPKDGPSQLVDVFDRGRLLTPEDARRVFEELSDREWKKNFLDSTSTTVILDRMLHNLLNAAGEAGDAERMLKYSEAILVINPDSGVDHFNCGRLCIYTQRWERARAEIEWLLSHEAEVRRADIDQVDIEQMVRIVARESQK